MIKKYLSENKILIAVFFAIFCVMLAANFLTPFSGDDFNYFFSFSDGERIENLSDIITSMAVHRQTTNGRIIAHSFVQAFLMVPKWVFNIVNSFAFVLLIVLILYYSGISGKASKTVAAVMIFALLWIFEPAFGQVNLWLDGSFNYLWAQISMLLFLLPYYSIQYRNKNMGNIFARIIFVIYAFIAGAYNESGSAAAIAMSALVIFSRILQKKKTPLYLWLSMPAALAGYCSMVFTPATQAQGRLSFSLSELGTGVNECIAVFADYSVIFAAAFLIIIYLVLKKDTCVIKPALVFTAGSFLTLFLPAFANFQSPRRACFSAVLLVAALFTLLKEIKPYKIYKSVYALSALIFAVFIGFSVYGFKDIVSLYKVSQENETVIAESRENGEKAAEIDFFTGKTKYSANNELFYYPDSMSKYYGITIKEKE